MNDLVLLKASARGHRFSTAWHAASHAFANGNLEIWVGCRSSGKKGRERRSDVGMKQGKGTCRCTRVKRRLQRDLIVAFQCIKGAYKKDGERL